MWIGHIWIRIRTSETYVWQCGLGISGLGLGPVRHVWQCRLDISRLGLGPVRLCVAVWIGRIWIRIRTSETCVWQCGLDISGSGLGPVRLMCGSVDWTYLD